MRVPIFYPAVPVAQALVPAASRLFATRAGAGPHERGPGRLSVCATTGFTEFPRIAEFTGRHQEFGDSSRREVGEKSELARKNSF